MRLQTDLRAFPPPLPTFLRGRTGRRALFALLGIILTTAAFFRNTEQLFLIYDAYVIFAVWYGDTREAIGVAVGSALATAILPYTRTWETVDTGKSVIHEITFLGASFVLIAVVARLRRAQAEAIAAHDAAEAALWVRDSFFATISHDLKSPLQVIALRAQLLHRNAQSADTIESRDVEASAASIDAAATTMRRLIDDILDLARLQAGEDLPLSRAPADLVALATTVAEEYQRTTRRHRLRVEAATSPLVGSWDANRLERVLSNLLSNAIKYSPHGGDVAVSIRQDGNYAVLDVRDQGLGIPRGDLPRLFERFHRAGNVGAITGTGLGLAGARQIVQQHGGDITLDSAEQHGTTVTIRLPLTSSL